MSTNDSTWEETKHATKEPRYQEREGLFGNKSPRCQKLDDIHHRDTKASKTGNTVRFTNIDDTDSFRVRQRGERNSPKNSPESQALYVTGEFDSDECDGHSQKRKRLERESSVQSMIASWGRNEECKESSREPYGSKSQSPILGYPTSDISVAEVGSIRTRTVGLKNGSPINIARPKKKSSGIRPQSATCEVSRPLQHDCRSVGKGRVKRSCRNERSNECKEMQSNGRRNTKDEIEDTLNESLLSLRKLREK